MILGIGSDIIEVSRIDGALKKFGMRFRRRIFTDLEDDYCSKKRYPAQHYAARFSAKEACIKALGTRRGMRWVDMEVCREKGGKPSLVLRGKAIARADDLKVTRMHLTMSHTADHAIAQIILEGED